MNVMIPFWILITILQIGVIATDLVLDFHGYPEKYIVNEMYTFSCYIINHGGSGTFVNGTLNIYHMNHVAFSSFPFTAQESTGTLRLKMILEYNISRFQCCALITAEELCSNNLTLYAVLPDNTPIPSTTSTASTITVSTESPQAAGHNEAKGSGSFSGDGVNVNNSSSDMDSSFISVVVIPVSVTTLLVAILTSICVVVGGICCICKKKTCSCASVHSLGLEEIVFVFLDVPDWSNKIPTETGSQGDELPVYMRPTVNRNENQHFFQYIKAMTNAAMDSLDAEEKHDSSSEQPQGLQQGLQTTDVQQANPRYGTPPHSKISRQMQQTLPAQSSESTLNGSSLLPTEPQGFCNSAEEKFTVV